MAPRDSFVFAVNKSFSRTIFEVDCAELHERLDDQYVMKLVLDEISELGLYLGFYSLIHTPSRLTRQLIPA